MSIKRILLWKTMWRDIELLLRDEERCSEVQIDMKRWRERMLRLWYKNQEMKERTKKNAQKMARKRKKMTGQIQDSWKRHVVVIIAFLITDNPIYKLKVEKKNTFLNCNSIFKNASSVTEAVLPLVESTLSLHAKRHKRDLKIPLMSISCLILSLSGLSCTHLYRIWFYLYRVWVLPFLYLSRLSCTPLSTCPNALELGVQGN